jgi:hypothetical protein
MDLWIARDKIVTKFDPADCLMRPGDMTLEIA